MRNGLGLMALPSRGHEKIEALSFCRPTDVRVERWYAVPKGGRVVVAANAAVFSLLPQAEALQRASEPG